jgi:hypothetical protein
LRWRNSEARSDLHGQPREFFHEILADQRRVPGGATADEAQPVEAGEIAVPELELGNVDLPGVGIDTIAHGAADHVGLLEDFLQHEMRIAALFRGVGIPADDGARTVNGRAVESPDGKVTAGEPRELAVFEHQHLPRLSEERRDIRGEEHLPPARTR